MSGNAVAAKVTERPPNRMVVAPIRPPPAWPWWTMRPSSTSTQPRNTLANRNRSALRRPSISSAPTWSGGGSSK